MISQKKSVENYMNVVRKETIVRNWNKKIEETNRWFFRIKY